MKFGRNYRLTIEVEDGEAVVIEPPITVQFNVVRNTMASLNHMQLSIYNLSEETQSKIFKDRFNISQKVRIVFQAGYDSLSTVFIGTMFQASSSRAGTDIITNIDARDGGFDTSGTLTNTTIEGGTLKDVIRALAGDFQDITVAEIGGEDKEFRRPVVLVGNTYGLIRQYTNNSAFVDLEELKVLDDGEATIGVVPLINSETGLLETPRREDAYLTITTLFEPRIAMGQILEIESSVNKAYDGQYKVIGVTHSGTISGAVGGECTSEFNLLVGSQLFGGFKVVS